MKPVMLYILCLKGAVVLAKQKRPHHSFYSAFPAYKKKVSSVIKNLLMLQVREGQAFVDPTLHILSPKYG